jgi:calcineurin-like phosphoesterase family protein
MTIILGYAHQIKYKKHTIYLSHYPTIVSNFDDKHFSQHIVNFHAHTHQRTNFLNPTNPFMYHVGMDSHNCTPVHIEEAISDIRNRWNEIGQLPTSMKPEDLYPYME